MQGWLLLQRNCKQNEFHPLHSNLGIIIIQWNIHIVSNVCIFNISFWSEGRVHTQQSLVFNKCKGTVAWDVYLPFYQRIFIVYENTTRYSRRVLLIHLLSFVVISIYDLIFWPEVWGTSLCKRKHRKKSHILGLTPIGCIILYFLQVQNVYLRYSPCCGGRRYSRS